MVSTEDQNKCKVNGINKHQLSHFHVIAAVLLWDYVLKQISNCLQFLNEDIRQKTFHVAASVFSV